MAQDDSKKRKRSDADAPDEDTTPCTSKPSSSPPPLLSSEAMAPSLDAVQLEKSTKKPAPSDSPSIPRQPQEIREEEDKQNPRAIKQQDRPPGGVDQDEEDQRHDVDDPAWILMCALEQELLANDTTGNVTIDHHHKNTNATHAVATTTTTVIAQAIPEDDDYDESDSDSEAD